MTLDGLFTLASLLAAVYALLPRDRRLNLTILLSPIDVALMAVAILAVHYLQFYDFFRAYGLAARERLAPAGITRQNASYAIMLAALICVTIRVQLSPLSKRALPRFRALVDELLRSEQHAALLSLFEVHRTRLISLYRGDPYSRKSWPRDRTDRTRSEWYTTTQRERSRTSKATLRAAELAQEIIRQLLLTRRFVDALARIRPYFALDVLELPLEESFDFVDRYLRALLADPHSVLCFELRNNQGIDAAGNYYLPESNRLLHYLFSDARIAEDLAVWKPVGETVIERLDRLRHRPTEDDYNRAFDKAFQDHEKWECPIFVGITFFDVMIASATQQQISWHMWLYNLPIWIERICENYAPSDPKVNPDAEWPTRYSYLMSEIMSALCRPLSIVRSLSESVLFSAPSTTDANHDNGNVPKSSLLALAKCIRVISEAPTVEDRFKANAAETGFSLYFALRVQPTTAPFAIVLRNALLQGGPYGSFFDRTKQVQYLLFLNAAFSGYDTIPHKYEHVEEFRQILADAVAAAMRP